MVPYMIPWGNYDFPRSTNKIQFFWMKFPHLEKYAILMKNLKYEHQSIFPLWGRVKLNFRDTVKFFHQIVKKWHFDVKKNNYPSRWICITHI